MQVNTIIISLLLALFILLVENIKSQDYENPRENANVQKHKKKIVEGSIINKKRIMQ